MDKPPPSRRDFIKRLTLALSVIGSQSTAMFAAGTPTVSFRVAGVRFYSLRHAVMTGDPVAIVESVFKGERCYAVYSQYGERIGSVPCRLVSLIQKSGATHGRVASADKYAVPWQRYRVTLLKPDSHRPT